ncbi:MAG: helix-turn-helix domain-containing protein, partial [Patescibacteria group bacterium]|nr:helix-turn-helix domain-containing protein [Patescibacteria group bacterium]
MINELDLNPDFDKGPAIKNSDTTWLSMAEAAGLTPYSAEYLSLLARKKKLTAKKVGKTWYTTKAVLDEYMKRQMLRNQIQNGDISSLAQTVVSKTAPAPANLPTLPDTEQPEFVTVPISPMVSQATEATDASLKTTNVPAADHPLTRRVRTFHDDLKTYLETLNSAGASTSASNIHAATKVEHIHIPDFFKNLIESKRGKQILTAETPAVPKRPVSPTATIPSVPAVRPVFVPRPIPVIPPVSVVSAPVAPPAVGLDAVAATLAQISERLEKIAANEGSAVARVLDSKLQAAKGTPNIVTRSFKTVFGSKPLIYIAIGLIIVFTIFPTPFVFGFFDSAVGAVAHALTNADTVMGFRPGTHANELLLLDKQGNISIMGHVETDGQFISYAKDGIAPIVVDSKTQVNNLNAEYVGGMHPSDFTLEYVTKNGNVTTEDVYLNGNVEVGKTLLVRGATKLLSSLEVDGGISVLGAAHFSQTLAVDGPAYFSALLNATDIKASGIASLGAAVVTGDAQVNGDLQTGGNLDVGRNVSVNGSLDVSGAVNGLNASFQSVGVSQGLTARGEIILGSASKTLTIDSSNVTLDTNGDLTVNGVTINGGLTATGSLNAAELNITGSTTIANLIAMNSSTTNATSTNLFATLANIVTLAANSVSVSALTATDTIAVNSTTTSAVVTNATTTNEYVSNLIADTAAITQASLVNALLTNSTTTDATTTNAYVAALTAGNSTTSNAYISSLVAATAALSNATTTNLFATNGVFSSETIYGTTTAPAFVATSTTATSTFAGNVAVAGNLQFGNGIGSTLAVNAAITSDLVPDINGVRNVGSPAYYWDNGYFNNLNVNSISAASTSIAGTASQSFTINSQNTTPDSNNMELIFDRGTVPPNAVIEWNATTKRFEFNQPMYVQNEEPNGSSTTLTIQGNNGQTGNIFEVSSSTGSDIFAVGANGSVGIGTSSPFSALSVGGNAYIGGNLVATGTISALGGLILPLAPDMVVSTDNNGALVSTSTPQVAAIFATSSSATSTFAGGLTVGGSQFLVQQATGRIGIGTTTPDRTLTLNAEESVIHNVSIGAVNGDHSILILENQGAGTNNNSMVRYTNTNNALAVWTTGLSTTNNYNYQIANSNNLNTSVDFAITTAGNVGIGTTSPSQNLSVQGNGLFSGDLYAANITATGTLSVKGSILPNLGSNVLLSTNSAGAIVGTTSPSVAAIFATSSSAVSTFAGNVGIGTTSPTQLLTVAGSGAAIATFDTTNATGGYVRFRNSS